MKSHRAFITRCEYRGLSFESSWMHRWGRCRCAVHELCGRGLPQSCKLRTEYLGRQALCVGSWFHAFVGGRSFQKSWIPVLAALFSISTSLACSTEAGPVWFRCGRFDLATDGRSSPSCTWWATPRACWQMPHRTLHKRPRTTRRPCLQVAAPAPDVAV